MGRELLTIASGRRWAWGDGGVHGCIFGRNFAREGLLIQGHCLSEFQSSYIRGCNESSESARESFWFPCIVLTRLINKLATLCNEIIYKCSGTENDII